VVRAETLSLFQSPYLLPYRVDKVAPYSHYATHSKIRRPSCTMVGLASLHEVIDNTWTEERSFLAHPPECRSVVCDCGWPMPRFHDTSAAY
jgi:hypothetical protein